RPIQLARRDRRLQRADIHRRILLAERVPEPALGQPPEYRHLAALERVQRHTRACLLPLHALARGLALPGPDPTPEPLRLQARASIVAQFIQLHLRTTPPPSPGGPPCGSCRAQRACPPAPARGASCSAPGR